MNPKSKKPQSHIMMAIIFFCFAAIMLCSAIFRENEGLPLLSFVLSIAWIILAIREIYFYFRDKKAAKD